MEYEKRVKSFSDADVKSIESNLTGLLSLTESKEHREAMKGLFKSKQEQEPFTKPRISQKLSISDETIDLKNQQEMLPPNRLKPLTNELSAYRRRRRSMPVISSFDRPSLLTKQRLLQHNQMLPKIQEKRSISPTTVMSGQTNFSSSTWKTSSSFREEQFQRNFPRRERRKSYSCPRSAAGSVLSFASFSSERRVIKKQKWRISLHLRKANLFGKSGQDKVTKLPKIA